MDDVRELSPKGKNEAIPGDKSPPSVIVQKSQTKFAIDQKKLKLFFELADLHLMPEARTFYRPNIENETRFRELSRWMLILAFLKERELFLSAIHVDPKNTFKNALADFLVYQAQKAGIEERQVAELLARIQTVATQVKPGECPSDLILDLNFMALRMEGADSFPVLYNWDFGNYRVIVWNLKGDEPKEYIDQSIELTKLRFKGTLNFIIAPFGAESKQYHISHSPQWQREFHSDCESFSREEDDKFLIWINKDIQTAKNHHDANPDTTSFIINNSTCYKISADPIEVFAESEAIAIIGESLGPVKEPLFAIIQDIRALLQNTKLTHKYDGLLNLKSRFMEAGNEQLSIVDQWNIIFDIAHIHKGENLEMDAMYRAISNYKANFLLANERKFPINGLKDLIIMEEARHIIEAIDSELVRLSPKYEKDKNTFENEHQLKEYILTQFTGISDAYLAPAVRTFYKPEMKNTRFPEYSHMMLLLAFLREKKLILTVDSTVMEPGLFGELLSDVLVKQAHKAAVNESNLDAFLTRIQTLFTKKKSEKSYHELVLDLNYMALNMEEAEFLPLLYKLDFDTYQIIVWNLKGDQTPYYIAKSIKYMQEILGADLIAMHNPTMSDRIVPLPGKWNKKDDNHLHLYYSLNNPYEEYLALSTMDVESAKAYHNTHSNMTSFVINKLSCYQIGQIDEDLDEKAIANPVSGDSIGMVNEPMFQIIQDIQSLLAAPELTDKYDGLANLKDKFDNGAANLSFLEQWNMILNICQIRMSPLNRSFATSNIFGYGGRDPGMDVIYSSIVNYKANFLLAIEMGFPIIGLKDFVITEQARQIIEVIDSELVRLAPYYYETSEKLPYNNSNKKYEGYQQLREYILKEFRGTTDSDAFQKFLTRNFTFSQDNNAHVISRVIVAQRGYFTSNIAVSAEVIAELMEKLSTYFKSFKWGVLQAVFKMPGTPPVLHPKRATLVPADDGEPDKIIVNHEESDSATDSDSEYHIKI